MRGAFDMCINYITIAALFTYIFETKSVVLLHILMFVIDKYKFLIMKTHKVLSSKLLERKIFEET